MQPLIDYFEDTWIGRPNRYKIIRRLPRYPIDLWNNYHASLDDLPKTNNSIEGWHRSFSSLVSSHHPNIWKFIDSLKKQQAFTETKIEQVVSGISNLNKRKTYKDTAHRIKCIVQEYGERNIIEYLRGIAHNFYLQSI